MGKKGDELRAKKAQTIYTFTREQLVSRDKAIIDDYKRRYNEVLIQELKKERQKMNEEAEKVWAEDKHDLFFTAMQYFCSMGCKVLVEKFKFKVSGRKDGKLRKFVNAIVQEVIDLSERDIDVEEYREELYRDYGVRFDWSDEENAEN